jgi:pyruvate kinase
MFIKKDIQDLMFGAQQYVDMVSTFFLSNRHLISMKFRRPWERKNIKIISEMETHEEV